MSTVLIQKVVEIYNNDEQPICAYIAQINIPHEKLLENTSSIRVGNVQGIVVGNEAVFNNATKQFTYIYTLIPDVVRSSIVNIDDNRIRFALLNIFEGWTINLIPNYSEYLDIDCSLDVEMTHTWDGETLFRVEPYV